MNPHTTGTTMCFCVRAKNCSEISMLWPFSLTINWMKIHNCVTIWARQYTVKTGRVVVVGGRSRYFCIACVARVSILRIIVRASRKMNTIQTANKYNRNLISVELASDLSAVQATRLFGLVCVRNFERLSIAICRHHKLFCHLINSHQTNKLIKICRNEIKSNTRWIYNCYGVQMLSTEIRIHF